MTNEGKYLIQVIADFLNERKSRFPAELDWNAFVTLAVKHQVAGIVFYQCGDFLPAEIHSVLEKQYFASVYYHANRQADIDKLDPLLKEADVPYFIVKGIVVSEYYPVPELRTMGDTDIIVHTEDRPKVRDIMLETGFETESISKNEWHFVHRNLPYELHDHLLYDENVNDQRFMDFFNDCWKYVDHDQLDPGFHFLFLLIHLRKHLMGWGVGFRQFMDVAVMAKNEKNLNWKWIQEKLEELQLTEFASVCFSLIDRWFDLSLPINGKSLDDSFYKEATASILANGIFGFDNQENATNSSVNDIRKKPVSQMTIITNGFRQIFPSYQKMCLSDRYRYLDGRPYLLPVAYVHRFIYALSHFSEKKYVLDGYFPSKSEVQKRKDYLDQWGL